MAAKRVSMPTTELTSEQLLLHVVIPTLNRLEKKMTDLSQSVDDLKGAVDGVAQRLLPEIAALEDALAAAQADDATAASVAADAAAAVQNIRTEVDRLNALGTDPSTPVDTDTPPADPPPVEVPADPAAPNQDLPGDQTGTPPGEDLPPE